jgi:deoxyribonuclease-4
VKLGAHESVAGGIARALARAAEHAGEALQIFTTSKTRWAPIRRDRGEIDEFAAEARRRALPILAHDSYLINLAATDRTTLRRSRKAFLEELERSEALGVDHVVLHPGSHMGAGAAAGMAAVASAIKAALASTAGYRVGVLLELTAGQGTALGYTFAELKTMLDAIGDDARTGVCFDTCHAFAAGYDLRRAAGYEKTWVAFDETLGLARLKAFHLNDSKRELGARVDRHEEIGAGCIGNAAFRRLVNDPRFAGLPAVLELPPEVVQTNLERLRSWRKRTDPGS